MYTDFVKFVKRNFVYKEVHNNVRKWPNYILLALVCLESNRGALSSSTNKGWLKSLGRLNGFGSILRGSYSSINHEP
jgi:hypothetical protein